MSAEGKPDVSAPEATGLRVIIIAGSWHPEVMSGLVDGALRLCAAAGASSAVVRVPGAFELPIVAARYAREFDAVVALGVIIRGGTPHFEYVCQAATAGLTRVALDSGTPVGFGLLTCDDDAQAFARAGFADSIEDKGWEAAHAAVSTAILLADPTPTTN